MREANKISFDCEKASVVSIGICINVVVEDVDVKSFMANIPDDDFVKYVRNNWNAEDIFEKDRLEDWAERNGYTKENN